MDLPDQGRRAANYLELYQWSSWNCWHPQRFAPAAAINWIASDHIRRLKYMGIRILQQEFDLEDSLLALCERLARAIDGQDECLLRTNRLEVVARETV